MNIYNIKSNYIMFKFPDTYNAKTLETLEYDDIIWIEHYTLQINLISF